MRCPCGFEKKSWLCSQLQAHTLANPDQTPIQCSEACDAKEAALKADIESKEKSKADAVEIARLASEAEAAAVEARREAKRAKKLARYGGGEEEDKDEVKGTNWQLIGAVLMVIIAIVVFYLWGVYYRRNRRTGRRL